MNQWYYSQQGKSIGPLPFEQLQQLAAQGTLRPDDLVWDQKANQWVAGKTVPGLFAAAPAQGILATEKRNAPPRAATTPSTPAIAPAKGVAAAPKAQAQGMTTAPVPQARTPASIPVQAATGAPAKKSAPGFLHQLRSLPKPILFGLFGALGGLLGALLFGELLWAMLAPAKSPTRDLPPLEMAVSSSLKAFPGGNNKFKVKIARHAYKGPVALAIGKTPPGVTIPAVTIPDGTNDVEVEVAVDKATDIGSHDIEVTGKAVEGENVPPVSGKLKLSIEPLPQILEMTVSPQVTVNQGGKTHFFVKIARTRFEGPVPLKFFNLPAEVTIPEVTIPADQSEARVEIRATFQAKTIKSDIIVQGSSPPEEGKSVEKVVSFQLEVKDTPIPNVDILFVLDLTASMGFAIDGVKEGIKGFVEELENNRLDARFGLIAFRDIVSDKEHPFALIFDGKTFTRDHKLFSASVGKLYPKGGGDPPESSLQALGLSAKQEFRPEAAKVLLLITDVPPKIHEEEDYTPRTIPETVTLLKKHKIDQIHMVIRKSDLKDFKEIHDAFPGNVYEIEDTKGPGAFASILPKLSEDISKIVIAKMPTPPPKNASVPPPPAESVTLPSAGIADTPTIQSVQSTEKYEQQDSLQLLIATGAWTAAIALAISLLLIAGQRFYIRLAWMNLPDFAKGFMGGVLAGLIGGMLGQAFFQATSGGTTAEVVTRIAGWGLLGALIGGGMAFVVPNLKWYRGLLGGILGGIGGALFFLMISMVLGALFGRLVGATVLGFFIGLMVALAELAFRRYWLEIAFGPREIRTVTLGTVPIGIGGDERLASVFVQGAPPLALRYRLDKNRVLCEDPRTKKVVEVPIGDRKQVGAVAITVCSPASARQIGMVLRLSDGRMMPLSQGLPLTSEDLKGLKAQGADGVVALISPRPNDPKTLMLRNRSLQTWGTREPSGKQGTVEPGRAIELTPNLLINFGEVQGKLIAEASGDN